MVQNSELKRPTPLIILAQCDLDRSFNSKYLIIQLQTAASIFKHINHPKATGNATSTIPKKRIVEGESIINVKRRLVSPKLTFKTLKRRK